MPRVEDGSSPPRRAITIAADVGEGHRHHPAAGPDVRVVLQEFPEVILLRLVEGHPRGRRHVVAVPRPPLRRWARRRQGREVRKVISAVAVCVDVSAGRGELVLLAPRSTRLLVLQLLLGRLVLLRQLVLSLLPGRLVLLVLLVLLGRLVLLRLVLGRLLVLLLGRLVLVRLLVLQLVRLGRLGLQVLLPVQVLLVLLGLASPADGDPAEALEGQARRIVHVHPEAEQSGAGNNKYKITKK